MTKEPSLAFDAAEYLPTPEDREGYVQRALEDFDARQFPRAVRTAVRARIRHAGEEAPLEAADRILAVIGDTSMVSLPNALTAMRSAGLTVPDEAA